MRKEVTIQLEKEKFWEKIINLKTKDEVREAFKKENIDVSDEELQEIGKNVYSFLEKLSKLPDSKPLNELSDEEIEKITGGILLTAGVLTAALTTLGYGAKSLGSYFDSQTAGENTKQVQMKTQGDLESQKLSYTWQGILHDNPGYIMTTGVLGVAGAAYAAKVLIGAIKDKNLLKWFEVDDEDED